MLISHGVQEVILHERVVFPAHNPGVIGICTASGPPVSSVGRISDNDDDDDPGVEWGCPMPIASRARTLPSSLSGSQR